MTYQVQFSHVSLLRCDAHTLQMQAGVRPILHSIRDGALAGMPVECPCCWNGVIVLDSMVCVYDVQMPMSQVSELYTHSFNLENRAWFVGGSNALASSGMLCGDGSCMNNRVDHEIICAGC
jgi:hypothetical protein